MTTLDLPPALSLAGQRVLVTGAANGIGKATAAALASLGATVVATDRAPLEAVGSALGCETIEGDLTDNGFRAGLFAGPRLHAVAHCAGVIPTRPWREDPDWPARFQRTMDINVRVPLELGTEAIDHMAAHGGGFLVLVGSVAGRTGGTSVSTPPDYSASKGAVHALVKWLSRNAVGRGVMVNAVAPGPVDTAMTRGFTMTPSLPLKRLGRPEELAWPIAFLCSPGASYMSGAILDVNGGAFVG